MSDEQNNKLIKYEPPDYIEGEVVQESWLVRKRREFEEALQRGKVRDPFSWTAFFISLAVSAASSVASYLISSALTPRPKPIQRGNMSGEVQGLMRSEQGLLVDEIYGGDPGDGKGGVKKPAIIIYATRPHPSIVISRQETGGGKFGGGSRSQEIQSKVYDTTFAAMGGRGELTLKREWGNTDKLIDLDKRGAYEGEDASNTFTAPYQINDDTTASDGKEVTLQGSGGASSAVQFNNATSHGAATRDLTIYYVNTGITAGHVIVNGGSPISVSFPNSSNSRSSIVVSVDLIDGANTIKIRNLSTTLNLRIDRIFCFPGFDDAGTTGVIDPVVPADPTYNPVLPFDPTTSYDDPADRNRKFPERDPYDVLTGQSNLGGYADFAVYTGNETQLEDPVIQAAIDAKYGAGSTPAYRGIAFTRHSNFRLDRWGSVMPNITQLWENATLKNLSQIFGQWCDRVNMLTSDYDFSGVEAVKCRGLLVSGRRYSPNEVMGQTEEIYGLFFTENDGQLLAILDEDAPEITIDESEIGWTEDEGDSDSLPGLDTTIANEIDSPQRVDVKFIDPDREYEPNTQSESRQVTAGVAQRLLEVSITLTQAEARAVAARKLYRDAVRGTGHRFTLSWKYLYLYPGYIINTTRNGIAISMQLTKKSGGISILDCEAEDIETAVLTQVAPTDTGVFEKPPVPIPAMTILALLDIPGRDKDADVNSGLGWHIGGTPRTNSGQTWTGASVYIDDVGWEKIADLTLPATIGVISDMSITATEAGTFDYTGWIEFDVYHTDTFTPTLESVSESDVLAGANLLAISTPDGEILTHFATCSQVEPNKWRVSTLLHGAKGTEHLITSYEEGRRVVLLNEAIQFVPMNAVRLNKPFDYRGVSFGASLDDSALLEDIVWAGVGRKPLSPVVATPAPGSQAWRDSAGDVLIETFPRARIGGGLRSNQGSAINEEKLVMKAQPLYNGSPVLPNGKTRVMTFDAETPQAAFLISAGGGFSGVSQNSFVPSEGTTARTIQEITQEGNYIEGTIQYEVVSGGSAALGLQLRGREWQASGDDFSSLISALPSGASVDGIFAMPYLVIVESTIHAGSYYNRLHVYEYGTRIFSASSLPGQPDYDPDFGWLSSGDIFRVRFDLVGSSIVIQKAHTSSVPLIKIATGTRATEFPMFGVAASIYGGDVAGVKGIKMTTAPFPKTIYAHKQIREDFLLSDSDPLPLSNEFDVWQWSSVVGDGQKRRVIL